MEERRSLIPLERRQGINSRRECAPAQYRAISARTNTASSKSITLMADGRAIVDAEPARTGWQRDLAVSGFLALRR